MRFPSVALLAQHAVVVLRRFPWTLAAGGLAAVTANAGIDGEAGDVWARATFVALLGLPVTIALTLLGEARGWSRGRRAITQLAGAVMLGLFFVVWPGIEWRHEAIRYAQLSAALHLAVAFLPFLGTAESGAFWQYNRRLFLGFLRAYVFSAVLFGGIAVALTALNQLFGMDIKGESYARIWFIIAFVVNTWIFLATVPVDVPGLARDTEYPRALKIFAQYILTPLAFTYLIILLAYLVKIVAGAEWPSGWIGWLVASVSVTGLLGFLLVHPLRADPAEGWIRTYTRWLFIGLIPAAMMLLVAFWKRIVPYGLTEPRTLGLVLGVWLLGLALFYTLRANAGIRIVPITLAALLLVTLYGPVSLTRVSISSQGNRLEKMLAQGATVATSEGAREASAALRFLVDHKAASEIAARIGRPLPAIDWNRLDSHGSKQDSVGRLIMQVAGGTYVPQYGRGGQTHFNLNSNQPVALSGFDWVVPVASMDNSVRVIEGDTVTAVSQPAGTGMARIRVGSDTLAFDLRPLARWYLDSVYPRMPEASARLRVGSDDGRPSALEVTNMSGTWSRDSLSVNYWTGSLLLRARRDQTESSRSDDDS
jgi:hypothetical protein